MGCALFPQRLSERKSDTLNRQCLIRRTGSWHCAKCAPNTTCRGCSHSGYYNSCNANSTPIGIHDWYSSQTEKPDVSVAQHSWVVIPKFLPPQSQNLTMNASSFRAIISPEHTDIYRLIRISALVTWSCVTKSLGRGRFLIARTFGGSSDVLDV